VLVLGIARHFFQADQNVLETYKIAAGDGNAAEGFEEGASRALVSGRAPWRGPSSCRGSTLRKLVGPQGFEKRRKFAKTCGDDAPRRSELRVEALA